MQSLTVKQFKVSAKVFRFRESGRVLRKSTRNEPDDMPSNSTHDVEASLLVKCVSVFDVEPLPSRSMDASSHPTPPALKEMDLLKKMDSEYTQSVLERWLQGYDQMAADAIALGIPSSAIPDIPRPLEGGVLRAARDRLKGMIESFLSSGL